MNTNKAKERIEALRVEINKYNHQYYVLSESLISDFEYYISIIIIIMPLQLQHLIEFGQNE